jgi:hypothetical protein
MNSKAYVIAGATYQHYKGGVYRVTAVANGGQPPLRANLVGEFKSELDLNLQLYTWRSHGIVKHRYLGRPGRLHVFYENCENGSRWVRPLMDFIDQVSTADGVVPRFVEIAACWKPD